MLLEALSQMPSIKTVKLSGNGFTKTSAAKICETWITKTLGLRAEGHTAQPRISYGGW